MISRQTNRILWTGFALAIVYFGIQSRGRLDDFLLRVGTLDAKQDGETLYLAWRGKVEAPMESRIREEYARARDGTRKVVLALSSPGGSLDHGARVVRLLREIRESHALETVVASGRRCASMCVPVYLQGERRAAGETAQFMFHEVSFSEQLTDERQQVPQAATDRETDKLFGKYFETAGVPAAWIATVRAEMAGGRDIWKTARELVDENAGIVLELRE